MDDDNAVRTRLVDHAPLANSEAVQVFRADEVLHISPGETSYRGDNPLAVAGRHAA